MDEIRYWEPETGSAWLPSQWENLSPERQDSCMIITEDFWMNDIIARNSAGGGTVENDPVTNLPCIVPYPGPTEEELHQAEIDDLKRYLTETDWMVTKCAELNLDIQEIYPDHFVRRQQARMRIDDIRIQLQLEA